MSGHGWGLARRRSPSGISSLAALLLLMVVAILAGLAIYAWVSGWLGHQLGRLEVQLAIQEVWGEDGHLCIMAVNLGREAATITSVSLPGEGITYELQEHVVLAQGESKVISVPYAWTYRSSELVVELWSDEGVVGRWKGPLTERERPYAIVFNGKEDKLSTPDADDLDLTEFTIECWVKVLSYGSRWGWAPVVVKGRYKYDTSNFALLINLKFRDVEVAYTGEGHRIYSNTKLQEGRWYHVVGVAKRKGANTHLAIYINGKLDYERTKTDTPRPNDEPLFMGANRYYHKPKRSFVVDDLRIYNRPLTPEEIRDNIKGKITTDGLVLWWRFDEGYGEQVRDVSGHGHTGTFGTPAPSWTEGVSLEDEQVAGIVSSIGLLLPGVLALLPSQDLRPGPAGLALTKGPAWPARARCQPSISSWPERLPPPGRQPS